MDKIVGYLPILIGGMGVTIAVAILSMALALTLGAGFATLYLRGGRLGRAVTTSYTTIARGIPDLVLMLLFFFGGERAINSVLALMGYERISLSPFFIGVVTLGFIFGAFLAETFRGAYLSVPHGQVEAAQAIGLAPRRILGRIIFPQMLRLALPGFTNTWLVMLKSTAIISIVGLQDMVGLADKAGKATREPFVFMLAVILFFLALTAVSGNLLHRLERRYRPGF
ncbi:ABC transporter permease subunit [Sedimentimonas flavescens]|uniref:ABC transporter permease subunit n=1 Tax=Sedimentimonas flavescens TaxID=2851012 RepID=A0ABT2ZYZ0_9RHOB|nr:ABC transporter permease subunit [Sedimentimonas flavescens]MCT2539667.1 ABC transporter permease subunit [Sedimentimonas flavescens]MCV2878974.1 ABC transporter permease subunit [Sedimentimonas flavescens]WBL33165.1 ABC transporter permease subunit [Sinirhodobacter sp. HNIBRBA609]